MRLSFAIASLKEVDFFREVRVEVPLALAADFFSFALTSLDFESRLLDSVAFFAAPFAPDKTASLPSSCGFLTLGLNDNAFLAERFLEAETRLDVFNEMACSVATRSVSTWAFVNWRYCPAGRSAGRRMSPKPTRISLTTRFSKCSKILRTNRFRPS